MSDRTKAAGDGGLEELVARCAFAVLAGHSTVTISAFGKRPKGFPRGELMSVGANGSHNYAVSPIKVLAWIHERKTTPPNAQVQPPAAAPRSGGVDGRTGTVC